jgi:ribosome-associated protein
MIQIAPGIWLDERDLSESFVRSSGPGGQNVNKVSSAVQLRYHAATANLPPDVKARLIKLAGSRMTAQGELVIQASSQRTQPANRQAALDRLVELLTKAAIRPRRRRATAPTKASQQRRVQAKKRRGQIKSLRRRGGEE